MIDKFPFGKIYCLLYWGNELRKLFIDCLLFQFEVLQFIYFFKCIGIDGRIKIFKYVNVFKNVFYERINNNIFAFIIFREPNFRSSK